MEYRSSWSILICFKDHALLNELSLHNQLSLYVYVYLWTLFEFKVALTFKQVIKVIHHVNSKKEENTWSFQLLQNTINQNLIPICDVTLSKLEIGKSDKGCL